MRCPQWRCLLLLISNCCVACSNDWPNKVARNNAVLSWRVLSGSHVDVFPCISCSLLLDPWILQTKDGLSVSGSSGVRRLLLISFRCAYRWASQETLMTLQTFRLGVFRSWPTTQRAMPCALCDSLCAQPAPTKGFSCSSCAWTCRLCVPGQSSSNCSFCFLGVSPALILVCDVFACSCRVSSCYFVLLIILQSCCQVWIAWMKSGVPDVWLSDLPFQQVWKKEREREKYEEMINADKSDYVEQTLPQSCYMISYPSSFKICVCESR